MPTDQVPLASPPTATTTVPDAVPAGVYLELKALPDPLVRRGLPAREPVYRLRLALKTLLREYGLRCCSITTKLPPPTPSPAPRTARRARKRPATTTATPEATKTAPEQTPG